MAVFAIPNKIYHGKGQLKALAKLKGKRATIVTGGNSMKRNGFLKRAEDYLNEAGMAVQIIDGVESDPSIQTCLAGGAKMAEFEPDWIIALGGGSALDAAKVMWIYYEYPDYDFNELVRYKFPKLRTKAKLVGVPSTSGTASEMTSFAVVVDHEEQNKFALANPQLLPDIAILDPEIPATMPALITAQTGMDALTHAIEAYVSTSSNDFTDGLAIQAIQLIRKYLVQAVRYPEDMSARSKMHNASALAGMAFNNVSLGITHSLAHKVGAMFHLAHGEANAIFLPYVIEYNRKGTTKYTQLEMLLKIDNLAEMVRSLNLEVGLTNDLQSGKNTVIEEQAFLNALDRLSELAFEDGCTLTNPRKTSPEDLRKLLESAYYGDSVEY